MPRLPRVFTTPSCRHWHSCSVMRVTLNGSLRLHDARSASYAAGSTGSGVAEVALLVDALTRRRRRCRGTSWRPGRSCERWGCAALDEAVGQLVLAAREAMTNSAKFSGADEVFVYAEADRKASRRSFATPGASASTAPP